MLGETEFLFYLIELRELCRTFHTGTLQDVHNII